MQDTSPELKITIKTVHEMTEHEKQMTAEIDRLSFTDGGGDIDWGVSQWLVMGWMDGKIVSQIGVLQREVDVSGQKINVGGVGGVATHPDHRRQGYAGKLLKAVEQLLSELDLPFGVLVCGEERMHYYARFGWQKIDNKTIFQNNGIDREMDGIMMILPLKEKAWPDGLLNLNGKPW